MANSNTTDDKIKPYHRPQALTLDTIERAIAQQQRAEEKRERVYARRVRISEAQGFARRTLACGCLECIRAWEAFDEGGPLLLHGEPLTEAFARRRRGDGRP